jgi:hypothetical protein
MRTDMNPTTIDALADSLTLRANFNEITTRDPLHVWELSGVERLHVYDENGDRTLIFKYATAPLASEAATLQWLIHHEVPVPHLLASDHRDGIGGLLLEDLADPVREATMHDAANAAVAAHRTPPLAGVILYDTARLGQLPSRCSRSLRHLQAAGRWTHAADVADQLKYLEHLSHTRASGAELAPWGTCHSEFHPTSLHISPRGWRLLDWARVFTGPQLLDLASWQGTREPPDLDALDALIDAYAAAGGDDRATSNRAGLPPARWALGWHRIWITDWYLDQCTTWIADPTRDQSCQDTVRRHLAEALDCLA